MSTLVVTNTQSCPSICDSSLWVDGIEFKAQDIEELIDIFFNEEKPKPDKTFHGHQLSLNSLLSVHESTSQKFGADNINKINQSDKDIVSGFIKTAETMLTNTESACFCSEIWQLISQICLLYYSNTEMSEYFSKIAHNMTIFETYHIIDGYDGDGTSYGNMKINLDTSYGIWKYVWSFKLCLMQHSIIAIGIDSSDKKYEHCAFYDCGNKDRYYASEMIVMAGYSFKYAVGRQEEYGDSINDGDEIRMELNICDKSLRFYINNIDQGIAYNNICFDDDVTYVMAVYAWKVPTIELTNFYHLNQM